MRVEFLGVGDFEEWFGEVVNPTKYDLYYVGPDSDLVAIKNVSTSPRIHAIIRDVSHSSAMEVAESYGRTLVTVNDFEWRTDVADSSD